MAAGAETDVVLKQLCKRWEPDAGANRIGAYHEVVSAKAPGFKTFNVTMPRFGLSMTPFARWTAERPPSWWTAYNQVKHKRHTHFDRATLWKCLNASAGLYVAVLFFYREEARAGSLIPPARLLDVGQAHNLGQFVERHIAPMIDVPAVRGDVRAAVPEWAWRSR